MLERQPKVGDLIYRDPAYPTNRVLTNCSYVVRKVNGAVIIIRDEYGHPFHISNIFWHRWNFTPYFDVSKDKLFEG